MRQGLTVYFELTRSEVGLGTDRGHSRKKLGGEELFDESEWVWEWEKEVKVDE